MTDHTLVGFGYLPSPAVTAARLKKSAGPDLKQPLGSRSLWESRELLAKEVVTKDGQWVGGTGRNTMKKPWAFCWLVVTGA